MHALPREVVDTRYAWLAGTVPQRHVRAMRILEPWNVIWRRVFVPHWPWLVAAATVAIALRTASVVANCWLDSSIACSEHAKLAAVGWLRFQWIVKYKELLAGILAVIGGTFAYFAATATISASESRAKREHLQKVESAVAGFLKSLTDVMHALNDEGAVEESLRWALKLSADSLCQASHRSFGILIVTVGRIERGVSALARSGANRGVRFSDPKIRKIRDQLLSDLVVTTGFLTSRDLPPDPGETSPGELAGKDLLEHLRSQKLPEPDPNDALTVMFDFTR